MPTRAGGSWNRVVGKKANGGNGPPPLARELLMDRSADTHSLFREALRLKRERQYEQAWDLLLSLHEHHECSDFYWGSLAHLALMTNRIERGIEYAQQALRLRRDNTFARSILAQLLERLGHRDDALEQYRLRLEAEFDGWDYKRLVGLGVEAGNLSAAEAIFGQWRDVRPGDPDLPLALAEGHRRLGEGARALPLYETVLEMEPGNSFARKQYFRLRLEGAPADAGARELETMLRLPDNRGDVHLMDLLAEKVDDEGDHERAAGLYRRILELRPDSRYFRTRLGFVLSRLGASEAVVELLAPCFEEDPSNRYVTQSLMSAMKRLGRKEEALRLVERSLSRRPDVKQLHGLKRRIESWPENRSET